MAVPPELPSSAGWQPWKKIENPRKPLFLTTVYQFSENYLFHARYRNKFL